MKTWIRIGSLVFAAILLLTAAGCGQGPTAAPEKSEWDKLPVLKVVGDSEQAMAAIRKEEKAIAEKFGVRIEYHYPQRLSDNLEEFLFASGETFDIYILFPAKIPQYVERNLLLPLDKYVASDPDIGDIVPIYRNQYMRYGGHDYGMVYDGDAHLLFYRKDVFEKYKDEYRRVYGEELKPPATWEEHDRIARFLTRDIDGDGKYDLYGTATFDADAKRYVWFTERFASMGGRYFDAEMKPQINNALGIKALKDWIALEDSGATPPQAMYDWIDLNKAFLQGKLARVVQWSDTSRFSFDQKTWNSQVAGKVGWTLVPGAVEGQPRGGTWIGRVFGISSQSKNPDKAWQVIQYLTSPEVSARAVTSLDTVNDPFRKSHFAIQGQGAFPDEATNRDFLKVLEQSLKNTNTDLLIPGGWEYMQALDQQLGLALIRKKTPEQALDDAAAQWEAITDRLGREQQKEHYIRWLENLKEVSAQ